MIQYSVLRKDGQRRFYQEIRSHGSLGYETPNEYDEYSRGIGCEKGAINRIVVVKK